MGGSGGQQGTIGVLREINLVSGTPTPITPVESPPKQSAAGGGG